MKSNKLIKYLCLNRSELLQRCFTTHNIFEFKFFLIILF